MFHGRGGLHISRNVRLTRTSENVIRQPYSSALWWLAGLYICNKTPQACVTCQQYSMSSVPDHSMACVGWVLDSTIAATLPITPFSIWSLGLEDRSGRSIRFLPPCNVRSFRRRRRRSRDDHGLWKRPELIAQENLALVWILQVVQDSDLDM
jgi:hypothetical protein